MHHTMAHTHGFDDLDSYSCWQFSSQPPTSVLDAHPETVMPDFTHTSSTLGPLRSKAFPSGIHFQTPLLPHTTITSSQLPVSIHQAPTFTHMSHHLQVPRLQLPEIPLRILLCLLLVICMSSAIIL